MSRLAAGNVIALRDALAAASKLASSLAVIPPLHRRQTYMSSTSIPSSGRNNAGTGRDLASPALPQTLGSGRTLIMGVLNVTPDSFSDGGCFLDRDRAVAQALRMVEEGADVIDVGGESTRPGSDSVSSQQELDRVLPVVEKLARHLEVPISIDTYKPAVAEECLSVGARIINDVSGLRDEGMLQAARSHGAAVVIMHMKGEPKTMQQNVSYTDVVGEVRQFLAVRVEQARRAGLREIVVDPGLGFGKTADHNFQILRRLRELESLGCPILIGPSRKSFLGTFPGCAGVDERLEGTIAAVCVGVMNGAQVVRVHDVRECRRALAVVDAIRNA